MSPVGTIFVPFPLKTGGKLLHPRPLPIVERVERKGCCALEQSVLGESAEGSRT